MNHFLLGITIESETLRLTKLMLMSLKSKDRFECIADNGVDEKLRKVIKIIVKGILIFGFKD
jgi:hypothetical protein